MTRRLTRAAGAPLVLMALAACTRTTTTTTYAVKPLPPPGTSAPQTMTDVAESYVKLVLALGTHDADYVDAYYGPPEWRSAAAAESLSVPAIRARAESLHAVLVRPATTVAPPSEMAMLRRAYLTRQLESLIARARMLEGAKLGFDDESRALYDAVAPHHDEAYFRDALAALDRALPAAAGATLQQRYERFRAGFIVPPPKVDAVFTAAIRGCRARTLAHIALPPDESFRVEYVTGKSWSGYNYYKGGYHSLIQVNTDLPIFIDRAIDLACHEGYPGHHVYNTLLEQHLVRERRWPEFTVYPLFSPQSLIAEGSANYGIEMAFPGEERVAFERDSLFSLAGLDPSRAAGYYRVQGLMHALSYAGNEAARNYLDGRITASQAADWLVTYALNTRAQAEQRVRFFDQYRSYVINYNLGQDLVKAYVEREGGSDTAKRWAVFGALLSSPRLPSGLAR